MASKKSKMKYNYKKMAMISLGVFAVFLALFLLLKNINFKPYYKLETRLDNIEKAREKDTDIYKAFAWLKIQGTTIDLAILNANRENSYSNSIPVELEEFGWTLTGDNKYHNVMNFMGHNIFNLGSNPTINSDTFHRFEDLMAFAYYDFAKENKYMQLSIDGKEYVYKIFAASFLYPTDILILPTGDYNETEKKDYIRLLNDTSIYDYDVDVNVNDEFLSVVTCTRMFGNKGTTTDFLIAGRRVRDGERINNFKVKKNKNYNSVLEAMKGDDGNENEDSI